MADHVAVALTIPQARQLREAARRWYIVKSMTDGPGRDMHAARAIRHAIERLDTVLGDGPSFPADPPQGDPKGTP